MSRGAYWDRALELAEGHDRDALQAARLRTQAHLARHAEITGEAQRLAAKKDISVDALYPLASAYAVCSEERGTRALVGRGRVTPGNERPPSASAVIHPDVNLLSLSASLLPREPMHLRRLLDASPAL